MRRLLQLLFVPPVMALSVACLVLPSAAQAQEKAAETKPSKPLDLQPLPEPPPPPAGFDANADEPQVTIVKRGADKVEEHRVNGKLYMLKVTPPHGVPYYMMDDKGDGTWVRQEPMDSGVRIPHWVIGTF